MITNLKDLPRSKYPSQGNWPVAEVFREFNIESLSGDRLTDGRLVRTVTFKDHTQVDSLGYEGPVKTDRDIFEFIKWAYAKKEHL